MGAACCQEGETDGHKVKALGSKVKAVGSKVKSMGAVLGAWFQARWIRPWASRSEGCPHGGETDGRQGEACGRLAASAWHGLHGRPACSQPCTWRVKDVGRCSLHGRRYQAVSSHRPLPWCRQARAKVKPMGSRPREGAASDPPALGAGSARRSRQPAGQGVLRPRQQSWPMDFTLPDRQRPLFPGDHTEAGRLRWRRARLAGPACPLPSPLPSPGLSATRASRRAARPRAPRCGAAWPMRTAPSPRMASQGRDGRGPWGKGPCKRIGPAAASIRTRPNA